MLKFLSRDELKIENKKPPLLNRLAQLFFPFKGEDAVSSSSKSVVRGCSTLSYLFKCSAGTAAALVCCAKDFLSRVFETDDDDDGIS